MSGTPTDIEGYLLEQARMRREIGDEFRKLGTAPGFHPDVCGAMLPGDRAGDCTGDQKRSKYHREITGIAMIDGKPRKVTMVIDFYDVVKAFDVRCGALQHLIKKALAAGQRGHKDLQEDMQDIVDSAVRAKELAE